MPDVERLIGVFASMGQPAGAEGEAALRTLVLQLALVLVASGLGAWVAKNFLRQPPVIGQILAGLAFGPSLLGRWAPEVHAWIAPTTGTHLLATLAELGLVLLVFQLGLEMDFRGRLGGSGMRTAFIVGVVGFFWPFAIGYAAAPWFAERIGMELTDPLGFRLMFACALSVTAVPVLGRIFCELGASHTRAAALSLGAAGLSDVLGWVVLGAIATYTRVGWDSVRLLSQLGAMLLGVVVVFALVRPVLGYLLRAELFANQGRLPQRAIGWVLLVVCVASLISSLLGVFALIGSLLIGVALQGQRDLAAEWERAVAPLVQALFVPLFFTLTGLRTDLGSLHGSSDIVLFVLILLLAFALKLTSGYAAARLCGESHHVSLAVGVAMNARGLMELVALNVGLSLGLIPPSVFTMMVLMAIGSTYVAAPMLRRVLRLPDAVGSADRLVLGQPSRAPS
jgi:Kef-type K+ transport system membrane component KefB